MRFPCFGVLPGSAETLVRREGKINLLLSFDCLIFNVTFVPKYVEIGHCLLELQLTCREWFLRRGVCFAAVPQVTLKLLTMTVILCNSVMKLVCLLSVAITCYCTLAGNYQQLAPIMCIIIARWVSHTQKRLHSNSSYICEA